MIVSYLFKVIQILIRNLNGVLRFRNKRISRFYRENTEIDQGTSVAGSRRYIAAAFQTDSPVLLPQEPSVLLSRLGLALVNHGATVSNAKTANILRMSLPKHLIWRVGCRKTATSFSEMLPDFDSSQEEYFAAKHYFVQTSTGRRRAKTRLISRNQAASLPASVIAFRTNLRVWHGACDSQSSESTRLRTRSDSSNRSNTFRR